MTNVFVTPGTALHARRIATSGRASAPIRIVCCAGPQSRRSATRARSARRGGPESRGGSHLLQTQGQPSSRLQVFKLVSELIHLLYKFRLAILFCYKATGS